MLTIFYAAIAIFVIVALDVIPQLILGVAVAKHNQVKQQRAYQAAFAAANDSASTLKG